MRVNLLLIAVLATALSACASYRTRPIAPAETLASLEARSLDDPGLLRFLRRNLSAATVDVPRASWDLESLSWVALYFQGELDVSRAQWRVAEAGILTAKARPNPSLDFLTQYATNGAAGGDTFPWTVGPTLNIPIETAGKRGHRIEQAKYSAEAARLNLADTAWHVRSHVRSALLGVYPVAPILQEQEAAQAEIAQLLEQRFAVGTISRPELTQARITLNQAMLTQDEAGKQLAQKRVQFASALGLPVSALNGIHLSMTEFELMPSLASLPAREVQHQALLNRPDVLAALAEYDASQSALQLEIAKQYPDLNIGPGYLWDAGQSKWSLGLSLLLPVLNRNEGPIAEAEARRKLKADQFVALQARAVGEVDQARAGYDFSVKKLEDADALLAAQRKNERSAAALVTAGETDRLALLSAQAERIAAELARIDALIQAQQTLGALEDAVRRPLTTALAPAVAIDTDPRQEIPER